jgi:hypothetical protein
MAHEAAYLSCDIVEGSVIVTVRLRPVVRSSTAYRADVRSSGFVQIAGEVYRWETVTYAVDLTRVSDTSSVPLFPDEIGL